MGLWVAALPLVLASKSAARRAVLEAAGVPVEICAADIDERRIEAQVGVEDPGVVAKLLAREKASAIASKLAGRLVAGADQTLALGDRRFSKPASLPLAREQLLALCGRTHELHAAVAVCRDDEVLFEHVEVARLTMRSFSLTFLDAYLAQVGPAACASVGGYQFERLGVQLFEHIEGDHFTIMGLPLMRLLAYLRRQGSLLA